MTLREGAKAAHTESESAAITEPSAAETIREMAAQSLKRAKDWPAAAKLMRKTLEKQPSLFQALTASLIDKAIWEEIRGAAHRGRVPFTVVHGHAPATDSAADIRAYSDKRRLDWLEYQMSSGLRLGDADHDALTTEAAMHAANARGNAIKASFYTAVAEKVTDGVVRDNLNHAALKTIWEAVSC